ncbi:MAG: hypothetical protein JWL77_5524 [Chthonomonadaceae bacterium]|nr:hypothetical protein [Chthonomonadaceae bacterium]
MPIFYSVDPENSGDWGGKTRCVNYDEIQARRAYRRKLENVEIVFDWMPQDDLITCGDCYMVSDRLEQALQDAQVSGVRFEPVKISKSDIFRSYYPRQRLPHNFKWMISTGEMQFSNQHWPTSWSGDDVCMAPPTAEKPADLAPALIVKLLKGLAAGDVPIASRFCGGRERQAQVSNQRVRRLEPKCFFSVTRAVDGSAKVPTGAGPDRKSMSTRPTTPAPNSM